jgi:uroporphyrinogen decarboxylase
MNSRQRALKTLRFEDTDRPPYDLMEGCVWTELLDYFRENHSLTTPEQVLQFLNPDFRWAFLKVKDPLPAAPAGPPPLETGTSKDVAAGPLAEANSVRDIDAYAWPDPSILLPGDFLQMRAQFPDKALVMCPGWMPLFWSACELFGMEPALIKMLRQPQVFDALIRRQHEYNMDILSRSARAARGVCDLAWLGDDFAGQSGMIISPALWRKHIKPYLAEQVRVLRENDMLVLFHSCGAVRPVLPDLIEIGINALLVFQTTARGMDPASIARDFGGKLAFYGGIDVQDLLSNGTPIQVRAAVQANIQAFSGCGGYIVANSHHTIPTIRGENILAMCRASKARSNKEIVV